MKASERFTDEAADALRDAIEEAGGNEVFVAGRLDAGGKIAGITVAARGHRSAVPALASFLERGDVIVHNHPSGELDPSEPDIAVASEAGSKGVGSYIVDNGVERVYVVAEPARQRALVMLDEEEIAGVLDAGGKLSSTIGNFESRPSQVRLTRDIVRAFNEGEVLAAEAGTGVGKSFAYLVPAFAWALRNEERVVIATATINLQKQLVDRDIPVVQGLFRKPTKAVLVKGRGNYLCRARLREAIDEEGLFAARGAAPGAAPAEEHPLRRIEAWAEGSASGDRADLSFWPEERDWSRVNSESETCAGLRCPERERCFVLRVRREAADAQVIVANHHVLFADLAARMGGMGYEGTAVLPPFRILVLDEAHAIESSATSFFSDELIRFGLNRKLSRVERRSRGRAFGISERLRELPGFPADALGGLASAISSARAAMDSLDARAFPLFTERERSFRLVERNPLTESALLRPMGELERALLAVGEILRTALEELPEAISQERAVAEARAALRGLSESAALCARFKDWEGRPDLVFWLMKGRTSQGEAFIEYVASPLDIGGIMQEAVFSKFRSVVCASATLSVGESFDFWSGPIGLRKSELPVHPAVYPSPFPYRSNALLALDATAPMPDDPSWRGYIDRAVVELLRASRGRALVLFTSYEALKSSFEAARPALAELGIAGMRQVEEERGKLLEAFRSDVSSVLFATDSFWEGVDAPGETLSLVIITKLPFRVPTDPVQLARSEALERKGGNAFMEISLPEAVIRLKQGFGRLIRHSEDRGAVAILDSRVVKKRYGGLFVESLPECRLVQGDLELVAREVKRFLDDW